jgi:gamma-glutamyltranspeptidase/glutathione hydrolase
MADYRPSWAVPARTTYLDHELNALGWPSLGAMNIVVAVNLMECSELPRFDHYSRSADALYRLIYCSRVGEFLYHTYAPEIIKLYIPEGDFTYAHLADKKTARLIWDKIVSGEWPSIERDIAIHGSAGTGHSEGIISVDREGNVAAVCHTINCDYWGNTGIFIDGVSVPGAAYYQRPLEGQVGPGAYLPDTTNPCLVLKGGRPVIASTCIGSDMNSATVQNLYNLLLFDYSWSESRALPKFQSVAWTGSMGQKVRRNEFPQALLDAVEAMGMDIVLVDDWSSDYWIGWREGQGVGQTARSPDRKRP